MPEQDDRRIEQINVDQIKPNPYQPRGQFDLASLEELASSIAHYGLIQPITVREVDDHYELIAGERRFRASKLLGLKQLPAIVMRSDHRSSAMMALIENVQRRDLNFLEVAEGYQRLLEIHGFTQQELAERVGKSQSTISNKMRLLSLSPTIREKVIAADLTERHTRVLLSLETEEEQNRMLQTIIDKGLTVRDAEKLLQSEPSKRKKRQKVTYKVKQYKLLSNTVKHALTLIQKTGVAAEYIEKDEEDYIDMIIRVPKDLT